MSLEEPQVKTSLINATEIVGTKYPPKCQYYFKLESEQPSGSFKLRGIGHLINCEIQRAKESGYDKVHVFSSSGGNAGLAAAYASRHFGVPCTVVLPKLAQRPYVIQQLESFGAQVVVHGEHWGEANEYMMEYAKKDNSKGEYPILCHPFDHPFIWEGHGIMIDEIIEQLGPEKVPKLRGIVCSVGGGGLYCGIVNGLQRNGLKIPVLAIETKPAPSFFKAVEANDIVVLKEVKTIATSLAAPYVASQALKSYKEYPSHVELVEDKDALNGIVDYYNLFDKVSEPACGATLVCATSKSELLDKFGDLEKDDIIVFVVCGGTVYSENDIKELIQLNAS